RKTPSKTSLAAVRARRVAAFLVLRAEGRLIFAAVLLLAALPAAVYWGWQHVGPRVLASADYQLEAAQIELVPPPESIPWIRCDLKREALSMAGLDGPLLIADDDLVGRISQAFKLQPWVAQVDRVTKSYPARVVVELTYRRPVAIAMVAEDNWWPVDADGFVLPQKDFPANEANRIYPKIVGLTSGPPRPEGERWGDERVVAAARIAAAFGSAWKDEFKLSYITPLSAGGAESEDFVYELGTDGGTRIVWGRSIDAPGEAPAAEKIARIREHVRQHGPLDQWDRGTVLDLGTTPAL
ncbi:MAG: hypothetical protein WD176_01365, partial [Pirellulales bacterium]